MGSGRGVEDFGRFIAQPLFVLSVYKAPGGGYCVGLLVKCDDPGGVDSGLAQVLWRPRGGGRAPEQHRALG